MSKRPGDTKAGPPKKARFGDEDEEEWDDDAEGGMDEVVARKHNA